MEENTTPTSEVPTTTVINSFLENSASPSTTNHEKVLNSLENDFKKADKIFTRGEMRIFGLNNDIIFKELDSIRKTQIDLAINHITMENLPDEEMPSCESNEDSEENFKRNSENFVKKKHNLNDLMKNLNSLMGKLEDLSQTMKISETNP